MPNLFILAGPNGAGKSTSAPEVLTGARRVDEFINADVIAKEEGVSEIEAGRRTLARLEALAAARRNIAFETTLSSRTLVPRITAMQATGYRCHLTFFWLHLFSNYLGIADTWRILDNTASAPRRLIAWRDFGAELQIADAEIWTKLVISYMKPRAEEPAAQVAPTEEVSWTSQDILDAVNRAVTAALKRDKERGESIVIWRDGKIVTLKPEEIDV